MENYSKKALVRASLSTLLLIACLYIGFMIASAIIMLKMQHNMFGQNRLPVTYTTVLLDAWPYLLVGVVTCIVGIIAIKQLLKAYREL